MNTTVQRKWRGALLLLTLATFSLASTAAAQSSAYVGSEICLTCHPEFEAWRETKHATGLKAVTSDKFSLVRSYGVVADTDGNGLDDFKQGLDLGRASALFANYGVHAPVLGYQSESGYTIRIGDITYPVRMAYGGSGSHRQVYVVKVPVSDRPSGLSAGHYVAPVQYNELTNQWAPYQPEQWYHPNGTPRIFPGATTRDLVEAASFERGCAGCHYTNPSVGKTGNEWVATAPPTVHYLPDSPHVIDTDGNGTKEQVNIGCERCHGPGLPHVISSGGRGNILNPARDLSVESANEQCGSCHARGSSLPHGQLDYAFEEQTATAYALNLGADLLRRFLQLMPQLWPDQEESSGYRQQFNEYRGSPKEMAGIRCSTCHDVHANSPSQLRSPLVITDVTGNLVSVPVKVEDNTQCLACHVGRSPFAGLRAGQLLDLTANAALIASEVSRHTRHENDPEGSIGLSRCTDCHMAKMATNAIPYDTASHRFKVVSPERTLALREDGGMPSSCAVRCHRPWAPIFGLPFDRNLTDWTESSDIQLAEWLREYYGVGGLWWNEAPRSVSRSAIRGLASGERIPARRSR